MTPDQVIGQAVALSVAVSVVNDHLHIDASSGVVTEELFAAFKRHKPAIIRWLRPVIHCLQSRHYAPGNECGSGSAHVARSCTHSRTAGPVDFVINSIGKYRPMNLDGELILNGLTECMYTRQIMRSIVGDRLHTTPPDRPLTDEMLVAF